MTMVRPALLVALLAPLALAGCASSPMTADATGTTAGLGVAVAPERAMAALPPEAGNVVSVVERRGDGTVNQTITLMGDAAARGDDRIEVEARERRFAAARPRLEAETIEAEMADALPGVAMTVSSRVVATPSGPVGVATGRSADGRGCLYAWSTAEARGRSGSTEVLGLSIASSTKSDLSVRVRLCRRGLDETRLIALAEGLRIRSDLGADVATRPVAGSGGDALAAAGYASVTPAPVASPAPVAAPKPVAAARAAEPTRAAAKPRVVAKTAAPPAKASARTTAATIAAPIPLPASGG